MRNTLRVPKTAKTPKAPSARHKRNSVHIAGAVVLAGALGLLTRRPTVFLLTAGTLIAASIHSGDMRLGGRR